MATTGLISKSELAMGRHDLLRTWSWKVFEARLEHMKGLLARRRKDPNAAYLDPQEEDPWCAWEVPASPRAMTPRGNQKPILFGRPRALTTPNPDKECQVVMQRTREHELEEENRKLKQELEAARKRFSQELKTQKEQAQKEQALAAQALDAAKATAKVQATAATQALPRAQPEVYADRALAEYDIAAYLQRSKANNKANLELLSQLNKNLAVRAELPESS